MGQQAGWYADPSGDATKLRYWDGTQWTDNFTPAPAPQPMAPQGYAYAGQPYAQPQVIDNESDRTLRLIAFIFCILSTISVCWLIIPLAWMIPMTVHCWGIYQGKKANTTAFGVCTLIFVTLVGGILLLVSKKDA